MPKYINADDFVETLFSDAITDEQRKFAERVKYAIDKTEESKDVIVCGRDYWKRYFDIAEKVWFVEGDPKPIEYSFCITRKE